MDELDRLYRRLVQNIRGAAPELLTRPFEVSQIYQELVPYRTNRRELAFDTNEDYELALMQLLAGLRGYVVVDAELQKAMRAELSSPNPDLAAFRVFATASVALATEPLRALEQQPATPRGAATGSPAHPPRAGASEAAALAARATEEFAATPAAPRAVPQPPRPIQPPPARPAAPAATPASSFAAPAAPRPAPAPVPRPTAPRQPPAAPSAPAAPIYAPALEPLGTRQAQGTPGGASEHGGGCRYCGGTLPDGRKVTFCPHCGHNLTVQHCPACATELEVEWKFCITCGRDVG